MKDSHEGENEELTAFALAVLMPGRMLAYIGAGTGSLIIQVVIAATVGGLFALKIYWRRIKAFFTRRKAAGEACDEQAADGEGEPGEAAAPGEELPGSGEGETQEEIEAALLPVEAGCDGGPAVGGENEEGETPETGAGSGEQPPALPESGEQV